MNTLRRFGIWMQIKLQQGKETLQNESGLSVVEMLLILVVIVALVMIFKTQLTQLVETIFEKITNESSQI